MEPSGYAAVWVLVSAVVVPLSIYVGAIAHEAGHALLGRWGGFHIASVGLGIARPFWVRRWRGTAVYLARSRPFQGLTFAVAPSLYPERRAWLLFLVGGGLAQGAFAVTCLLLASALPREGIVLWLVAVFNCLHALLNLVPLTLRVGTSALRSDGAQMVRVVRYGSPETSLRDLVHLVDGLRGLWRDVGDTLTLRITLLGTALGWLELGAVDAARSARNEAEALPEEHRAWVRAYTAVVDAAIASTAAEPDVAREALDRAEQLFVAERHVAGRVLIAMGRAVLLHQSGDIDGAVALLARLADAPELERLPHVRAIVITSRLTLSAERPGADLAALEAAFPGAARTSDAQERTLFSALARAAVASGDDDRAERTFLVALAAAARMHDGWVEPRSRDVFLGAQEPLFADARAFFARRDPSRDMTLEGWFPLSQDTEQHQLEHATGWARRVYRWVRRLALAGLTGAAVVIVGAAIWPETVPSLVPGAALVLAVYGLLVALLSGAMQLVGRWQPGLGRMGAWFSLTSLLGGWVILVAALVSGPSARP